ncbi:MAG TPA: putative baseplate assembly protein [Vicinamibacterales bacterium]|nr:putative baseplate assembly protein [Vicinamibacterales bacterium]
MARDPVIDARRVESLVHELRRYAPHYTPELSVATDQAAGGGLFRAFAQLAETVLVRLARAPQKHFVAFLDRLGITLLPARPARAPITFTLAAGFPDAVTVPAGTRVTAQGPDGDIPFETTGALQVIPAIIAAAYGVDPDADAIYPPPPGFLDQTIRTPTELAYRVLAFTPAGSRRVQLDHTTELKPQAMIRIDCRQKAIVAKVDANIVTLESPLERDADGGAIVTPIRDFEPFNGINLQEHALYLGDPDLFAVKNKAYITISVTLFSTPGATPSPLRLAWQFWTKAEEDGTDAEEHWETFDVDGDGTEGLSKSGTITLVKEALEIKEREVGGRKNRWIRALLLDPLPAGGGALPEIDRVTASVQSTAPGTPDDQQTGILADQGFYNATPLDLKVQPAVGFLPFGTEPRQFDQFYIASKEAFSKRGATVKLDVTLDLQTLASPTAVALTKGLRVYSIGLRRRLYELDVAAQTWTTLGSPGDLPTGAGYQPLEDSIPSAIASSTDDVYVFVNTEDTLAADPAKKPTKVCVCFRPASSSASPWIDLGTPTDVQVKLNPVAILLPGASPAFARVFVAGADGKLYSRDVSNAPAPTAPSWTSLGSPSGTSQIACSPFVTTSASGEIFVFVIADDDLVYMWRSTASAWTPLTPADPAFKAKSRPFAQPFSTGARVFVVGETSDDDRKLFECDTTNPGIGGTFTWTDLDRPPGNPAAGKDADSLAPVGYVEKPGAPAAIDERRHIFLRDASDQLFELLDTPAAGTTEWVSQMRTGDPALRDAPFALVQTSASRTTVNITAASARNSIVTWTFESVEGAAPATPQGQGVLLGASKASADDNHYVSATQTLHITDGVTSADRLVLAYDGHVRVARLATPPLAVIPDSTFTCTFGTEDAGAAEDASDRLVVFRPPAARLGVERIIALDIAGTIVNADFYSRLTGIVSIAPAAQPASGDAFNLYVELVPDRVEFLSTAETASVPELSWEYWNGSGWLSLDVDDGSRNLLVSGKVTFTVPDSIQPTEVVGQQNFWIRARLVGGDYGRETFKVVNNVVVSEKSTLRPPKVSSLRIIYIGAPIVPGLVLTANNLDYLDQTAASLLGGAHFRPFEPLEREANRSVSLFLGFDQPFKSGPVRLLVDAAEREYDEGAQPELDWQFRKDRRWKPLDADDGSTALTRPGILTLSASDALTRETRFGQPLFWIRGSLRTDRTAGLQASQVLLRRILLNTVEAEQGETITGEIVGSSDGEPNQSLAFQHANVLADQDLRVQEALSAEEQERIRERDGKDAIVTRDDLEGLWVRWRETQALFDAGPDDRCYLIDRAAGVVQFGDGAHGRIPPAGVDNIRAFRYRTGGGAAGNVAAGKIDSLTSSIAGVDSVFNAVASAGGSDAATTEAMLDIGPRRISHRDRAVSAQDFEDLAREASRQVAKVRCLATTNLTREGIGRADPCDPRQRHRARPAPGYVSLIVVPVSDEARPCPSLELRRAVKEFLRARTPGTLASGARIVIRPPDYVEVSVHADIVVTTLENAAAAESKARAALDQLLHPLYGGPDGTGWEFGRPVWKSDVFSRLERIEEVDSVENLRFLFRGTSDPDRVAIGPNELLASGTHVLAIRKG